jgi:D-alanyl-D-alanine carboxypeptidase
VPTQKPILSFLLVLLLEGAAHAQDAPPPLQTSPGKLTAAETEAAREGAPFRQFSAWLEAFNSGDPIRIRAFLDSRWAAGKLDRELTLRDRSGGFELRALEQATTTSLTGIMQERDSDQFARFNIAVAPDEPERIKSFNRRFIARPAEFPVPPMSEAEIIAALGARLEKDAATDRFAGTVMLTRNGKVLFSGAYGLADRGKKVANTLDTRFRVGSINKMFTGTAILQLVQAGKIALNDPLGKYLTDYPNQDVADKVTIHQLLTHTGGTGDIFGPEFDAHRLELRTLDDYVALLGKRSLAFEPGARWEYSNYGMVLLGCVIERVSGQSYYDYVAKRIYKPAGMTRTGSEPENKRVTGRSIGYTRLPGATAWTPNTDTLPFRGTSAGGGYSTVGDLVKFSAALVNHELLDAEHTQLLITGKVDTPAGKYAYGFDDLRKDGAGAVGHAGGAPGMNGMLRIFPKSGYVVAVLSNFDPPAAQRVAGFLELRLENRSGPAPALKD